MGLVAVLGYGLIAGGPALVAWCLLIAGKSFLVLLALARYSAIKLTGCKDLDVERTNDLLVQARFPYQNVCVLTARSSGS